MQKKTVKQLWEFYFVANNVEYIHGRCYCAKPKQTKLFKQLQQLSYKRLPLLTCYGFRTVNESVEVRRGKGPAIDSTVRYKADSLITFQNTSDSKALCKAFVLKYGPVENKQIIGELIFDWSLS